MRLVAVALVCAMTGVASAGNASAERAALATLTLSYQDSLDRQTVEGGKVIAGAEYLGSGDGSATGVLGGHVRWDLYENHSRDDLHPTEFRGFVERNGKRHPFEIIGVFTPQSGTEIRRWNFSGTIVFDDTALLSTRHAPITGYVETGVWRHHYTVLGVPDAQS